jgi:hypothetical protein
VKQLAGLVEIRLRKAAADLTTNLGRGQKIGLTEKQRAELRRIAEEGQVSLGVIIRENSEKSVDVLTPAQQEKLRREIDRNGVR